MIHTRNSFLGFGVSYVQILRFLKRAQVGIMKVASASHWLKLNMAMFVKD